MAGKWKGGNAIPVSDLSLDILEPILRKRAGISMGLVQSWEEIAGERLGARSRPEKILWPRRAQEDDPFEPATLVVAAEGIAALHLQHETGEIIARVNAYLGFNAIGRIRIVQKPVATAQQRKRPAPRQLSGIEISQLSSAVSGIERDDLRASLEKLGRSVLGSKKR
jgi:hypothetical protein